MLTRRKKLQAEERELMRFVLPFVTLPNSGAVVVGFGPRVNWVRVRIKADDG
jgi:hypothetical protein